MPAILDEGLAAALCDARNTEVEIMPHLVNVQLREAVFEAEPVRPLLDLAARLVTRRRRFALEHEGVQVRSGRVQRGCVTGWARANDEDVTEFRHSIALARLGQRPSGRFQACRQSNSPESVKSPPRSR